ncbi:MAG TPA: hypothetical protein VNW15_05985 [Rhizomicrobium sp.]|jgi:hypothetical protein|nr:hypothetical protein [Rhizomicrobium sp.]
MGAQLNSRPDDMDGFLGNIRHLVKSWNDWSKVCARTDRENYIDGNIELLFEHAGCGRNDLAKIEARHGMEVPLNVFSRIAKSGVDNSGGEIGHLLADNVAIKTGIIARWGREPMLVESIQILDEVEDFISSRFTVRPQFTDGPEKSVGYPVGQSVLYGFLKPCLGFTERKLNIPFVSVCGEGRNDGPIGMVKSGPDVMNDISNKEGCLVYDGYVLFGSRGALAGYCVCFNDVGERALFLEKFVKLIDVFRGPLDL